MSEEEKTEPTGEVADVVTKIEDTNQYEVISDLRKPLHIADLGRACLGLYHVHGIDMFKRGNLSFIETRKIVYVTSNSVVFQDIDTGLKSYLLGIDEGGVGCVCVHPSKSYIAVGGNGFQPKIYIYSYPELKVILFFPSDHNRLFICLYY